MIKQQSNGISFFNVTPQRIYILLWFQEMFTQKS